MPDLPVGYDQWRTMEPDPGEDIPDRDYIITVSITVSLPDRSLDDLAYDMALKGFLQSLLWIDGVKHTVVKGSELL